MFIPSQNYGTVLVTEEIPDREILFSDDFKSRLRTLAKRYRSIRSDLQPLLDELQSGNFLGDRLTKTSFTTFKVRLKNSDIQKGKSGGYRVIYQLRDDTCVLLIVIYSKSDQEDVSADQIRGIIASFDEQMS
jgi:mRNA-degrading endonuclease RelE of RelBE toxin-antitoxin system